MLCKRHHIHRHWRQLQQPHRRSPQRHINARTGTVASENQQIDTQALLANAYETIAGAGAMTHEFVESLPSQQRYLALAIQQMIELGLLLVEAVQDRVDRAA